MIDIKLLQEGWSLQSTFTISRGSKTQADVAVVALCANGTVGYGECVPYARYAESVDSMIAQIVALRDDLRHGLHYDGSTLHEP